MKNISINLTTLQSIRRMLIAGTFVLGSFSLNLPAEAQEVGSPAKIDDAAIEWMRHNQWNDVNVRLRQNINCGSRGSSAELYLLDDHVGEAKSDMYSMLLSGFLAGRRIDLDVVSFGVGGQNFCSIKRVWLH